MTRRNGAIDGWRGLSVLLVVVGHLVGYRYQHFFAVSSFREALSAHPVDYGSLIKHLLTNLLAPLAPLGVGVFFVISGFLITTIMLSEERDNKRISLAAFYVRRIGRIVPAFATYMAALFTLKLAGLIEIPGESFLWAGLYVCNISTHCSWWLGHTWSLSVEEQFYLVWPLLFLVTPNRGRAPLLAFVLIGVSLTAIAIPDVIPFALIAIGALYAASPFVRRVFQRLSKMVWVCLALAIVLLQPFLAASSLYPVLVVAKPFLIGLIFFATIQGVGPLVTVVSWRWLQRIGLWSYSIYLWQQLSLGQVEYYDHAPFLLVPVLFVIPALLSYTFVEQPFITIAHRLSKRLKQATALRAKADGTPQAALS